MSVLSECGSTFENFGYHWKHLRLQMKSTQLLVRTVHLNKILKWNALVSLFLNKIDEATRYGLNFEIQTLRPKVFDRRYRNIRFWTFAFSLGIMRVGSSVKFNLDEGGLARWNCVNCR